MHVMAEEEKFRKALAGDAVMIASIAKGVKDKFGDPGIEAMRDALTQTYRKLIPVVARQAGARVLDGTIADWLKVETYMCQIAGMEYETEQSPSRGVLRVKSCPMEGQYRRLYPDICPVVFIGIERGIASAINPRMKVTGGRYLPRGEGCCEIICELSE